jgi:hypothetical protein
MARYILEHDFGLATVTQSSLSNADSLTTVLVEDEFVKAGRDIAMKAQNYLGSQLMGAIHSGGFAYAVEFCHLKASVIMDSLSNVYDAEIFRRTDKARNPDHQASDDEIAYMEEVKKMNTEERLLTARKVETDSGVVCYFPILTKEMCLSCHGRPNMDIERRTLKRIDALYPEDKARGYHQGDVRGLFSVYFRKKMGQESE